MRKSILLTTFPQTEFPAAIWFFGFVSGTFTSVVAMSRIKKHTVSKYGVFFSVRKKGGQKRNEGNIEVEASALLIHSNFKT